MQRHLRITPVVCLLASLLLSFPLNARAADDGETPAADQQEAAAVEQETAAADSQASTAAWPAKWVTSLAVLGEGDVAVAATAEGLLYREASVVEFSLGELAGATPLYQHPASVWAVVGDAQRVISSDYQGNLAVYDRAAGELVMHEGVLEKWTRCLEFDPAGEHVVAGNEVGKLFAWSLEKGAIAKTLEVDAQQIYAIAFSPAGDQLVAADGAGHLHLVSWPELASQRTIELGEQAIWEVSFSADGNHLIAGGADQKLWRIGLAEGAEPEVLATTGDWISALAVDKDSGEIILATLTGQIMTLSAQGAEPQLAAELPSGVWALLMPGSGKLLAATRKHAIAGLGRAWTLTYLDESAETSSE